jgi:hypothetical protein
VQNFLKDIVSPSSRRWVYAVYSLIGLALGCIQAGFGAVNAGTPDWLKICLAVYAFFGTAIGATAASNVTTPPSPPSPS